MVPGWLVIIDGKPVYWFEALAQFYKWIGENRNTPYTKPIMSPGQFSVIFLEGYVPGWSWCPRYELSEPALPPTIWMSSYEALRTVYDVDETFILTTHAKF